MRVVLGIVTPQGPPGVGKTHLAISLGIITAELGYRIYFTSAMDMARRLAKAMQEGKLSREMNNLVRPTLLVLDSCEVPGYVEYP